MAHPRAPMERLIRANADEINRLRQVIRDTAGTRWRGPEQRALHAAACAEYQLRYDQLAFPGGYDQALKLLAEHDPSTLDVVLLSSKCGPTSSGPATCGRHC